MFSDGDIVLLKEDRGEAAFKKGCVVKISQQEFPNAGGEMQYRIKNIITGQDAYHMYKESRFEKL